MIVVRTVLTDSSLLSSAITGCWRKGQTSLFGVCGIMAITSGCGLDNAGSIPVRHPICSRNSVGRVPALQADGRKFNPCREYHY